MAVTGPDFIALQVRDLEASARFYADRLGLARAGGSPPGGCGVRYRADPVAVREPAVDLDAASRRAGAWRCG